MKKNTAQNIIEAAAPLIHRRGFHHTGLKEIVEAAGVPKGSFYFYFKSKEDFGLALIDHYSQSLYEDAPALGDASEKPALERLRKAFEAHRDIRVGQGCEGGCPLGNLAQEMSDLSPRMRERLQKNFNAIVANIASLLREARERGEVPDDLDIDQTAGFIFDAWEGALLRMKTEKSVEPVDRFLRVVFDKVLA